MRAWGVLDEKRWGGYVNRKGFKRKRRKVSFIGISLDKCDSTHTKKKLIFQLIVEKLPIKLNSDLVQSFINCTSFRLPLAFWNWWTNFKRE